MRTSTHRVARHALARAGLAAALGVGLAGCVANSSNPQLTVASAQASDSGAVLDLDLANPGGRDLVVTQFEYRLNHGDAAFPVGGGTWKGELDLKAHTHATLRLDIPFSVEPIEPGSDAFQLQGDLRFRDLTGFMGMQSMDLTGTTINESFRAGRMTR